MAQLRRDIGTRGNVVEKQLGQLRPANTTAASIYSPGSNIISTELSNLRICNTTGSEALYRVFHDNDGTTYDETTAIHYDSVVGANQVSIAITGTNSIYMNDRSGNLAVRTNIGNAITFTLYGIEYSKDG